MDVQEYNVTMVVVDQENPSGVWNGAPALAASGVVMTNTSGYPVAVGVSGGTVTAISINGVPITALTSGRFRLRRGGTIAITYSVAPTMQWLYE